MPQNRLARIAFDLLRILFLIGVVGEVIVRATGWDRLWVYLGIGVVDLSVRAVIIRRVKAREAAELNAG